MSIPENIELLRQAIKPNISRFKPGDLVYEVADQNMQHLVVTNIHPKNYKGERSDYGAAFLSSQGKAKFKSFEEKELKLVK